MLCIRSHQWLARIFPTEVTDLLEIINVLSYFGLLRSTIAKYRRIRTKRCRILIEGKAEERALPFGNESDDNETIDHKDKLFYPKYKVFGYS